MPIQDFFGSTSNRATNAINDNAPSTANLLRVLPLPAKTYTWTFSFQKRHTGGQGAFSQALDILEGQLIRLSAQQVSVNSIDVESEEFENAIYNSPFITGLSNNTATVSLVETGEYQVFEFLQEWIGLAVNNDDTFEFPSGGTATNVRGTVNPPINYYMTGRLDLLNLNAGAASLTPRATIELEKTAPTSVAEIDYNYDDNGKVVYNLELSFERFEISTSFLEQLGVPEDVTDSVPNTGLGLF